MRSDRDTLDSAGEVGQPPVLFLLFVVSGSWLVFAALWPYRRGRPKGRPAVIFDHSLFRMMVSFYEPRTTSHGFFFGFRCGVPPRQAQADNDASGNPQRVVGRLSGRPLRYRIQAMKGMSVATMLQYAKNTAIGLVRRGRPG